MKLETIKFNEAINKAYFKQSLKRADIELFKTNFKRLFERINETESEEHNKNIVADFLKNTFYKNKYEINTSGRKDLVIHKGNSSQSPVSVLIEVKRPATGHTPLPEMISFDKPNAKALHETIHYYLHERLINQNKEIKHIVITNIYDWFIFDATEFEKYFVQGVETRRGVSLRKKYQEWTDKKLVGTKTDWFYNEIAKPFIENELDSLQCVYINLLDYLQHVETLHATSLHDDHIVKTEHAPSLHNDGKLINLYKIFSPEHLLKLPFANDYNKIDTGFYNELLHILGLEETKQGGKKLITRIKEKERKAGSLLENAINIIKTRHRLKHIERPDLYGENEDEQIFSISLELVITWLNRILFLKLLEAQLVKYHKGNRDYEFLSYKKINDFDELDELFFEVLAKQPENRSEAVNQKFGDLPYLNSSLFEISGLENEVIFIENLKDRLTLKVSKQTVLKDKQGNKFTGELNTLEYLFDFLNAYSFASDDKAEIQNDNRTIINAAVLGLIFEKINGYKDGSFYTPSFITSFISRETIRKSVVDKFNEANFSKVLNFGKVDSFEDLKDKIDYSKFEERKKANGIINSIKICDPAVGSGHFLVSALNELVAVKSELKILSDVEGKRIRGIKIDNVNDELEIIDEETSEPFQYYVNEKGNPPSEIQSIQEAIFNEKRNLIENCIYGVDINPKSVLICRLRLWIELLKNTYYIVKPGHAPALQTLPNIDINIKTGNSLISKFDTGLNIFEQKAVNNLITQYKFIVDEYKRTSNYEEKEKYREQIKRLKTELEKYAIPRDKHYRKYLKKKDELGKLLNVNSTSKDIITQISKLSEEVSELEKKYKVNYYNVYANAMEWSVEFPEILSGNGEFKGFDIVMGNPPYISISKDMNLKEVNENYTTYKQTGDVYMLFIERALQILKQNGRLSYITSNKWLRAAYGESLREYLLKNTTIEKIIDFDGLKVFDEATVDTGIIEVRKHKNGIQNVEAVRFDKTFNLEKDSISEYFENHKIRLSSLDKNSWNLKSEKENAVKNKLEQKGKALENWNINIYRGITTGLNEAFVIDEKTKNELIKADKKNGQFIKPLLRGRDIKKYCVKSSNLWLIIIPKGYTIKSVLENETQTPENNNNIVQEPRYGYVSKPIAWKYITENHQAIANHLKKFEQKAVKRDDKGDFWWELRACAYYSEFEKEKIIFTKASKTKSFAYDSKGYYLQNTSYILIGEKLKYLLALLNSKLTTFAFLSYYQSGGIEGEITVQAINKLPIPAITKDNQETVDKIETLVNKILKLKESDSHADISAQQAEIDKLVYHLYSLTDEEIEMIENQII